MLDFNEVIRMLGLTQQYEEAKSRFNTTEGLQEYLSGQMVDDGHVFVDSSNNPEAFMGLLDYLAAYARANENESVLRAVLEDLSLVTADRFEPALIVKSRQSDGTVELGFQGVGLQLSLVVETTEVDPAASIEDLLDTTLEVTKHAGSVTIFDDGRVSFVPFEDEVISVANEPGFPDLADADVDVVAENV